jgi:hypothetical protein
MAIDTNQRRSRRSLLAAAAGGAAAIAASKLIDPTPAAAITGPVNLDVDNLSTALTSITQGTADTGAFEGTGNGTGTGLKGSSTAGVGVLGAAGAGGLPAIVGLQGDATNSAYNDAVTAGSGAFPIGTYGYAGDPGAIGAVGETATGVGSLGFGADAGSLGMAALGALGAFIEGSDGAFIVSDANGNGLQVHVGEGSGAPLPPANTAIYASVSSTTQVGLEARGRVRFPNRSGKTTIGAGKSSIAVAVSGMTATNFAIATINSNRPAHWIRAVVCSAGKITIYLNTAVTNATFVAWLVLG